MFLFLKPLTQEAEKTLKINLALFRAAVTPRIVATDLVDGRDIRIDAELCTTMDVDEKAVAQEIKTTVIAWMVTGVTDPDQLKMLSAVLVQAWTDLGLETSVGHLEVFDISVPAWATTLPPY